MRTRARAHRDVMHTQMYTSTWIGALSAVTVCVCVDIVCVCVCVCGWGRRSVGPGSDHTPAQARLGLYDV
jgi:hypothetical protein